MIKETIDAIKQQDITMLKLDINNMPVFDMPSKEVKVLIPCNVCGLDFVIPIPHAKYSSKWTESIADYVNILLEYIDDMTVYFKIESKHKDDFKFHLFDLLKGILLILHLCVCCVLFKP